MKAPSFIVTQASAPCALAVITGKRGTALMPGSPITIFSNRRRARTAVKRTQRIAAALRGSMLDEWDKLRPLFSGEPYKIEPVEKSQ